METATIIRRSPEVDLERGINSPAHDISTDAAPPYESIVNAPKDIE
jgi:hypothetical protein